MSALNRSFQWVTSRFVRDDEGASAVEYGLLVGLIAVVIIGAVILLGGNLNTMFQNVADALTPAA